VTNLKGLPFNLHPTIIDRNWERYKQEYHSIEGSISEPQIPTQYRLHPITGALLIGVKQFTALKLSTLKEFFLSHDNKYSLRVNDDIHLRGRSYYPGITNASNVESEHEIETDVNLIKKCIYSGVENENINLYLAFVDLLKNHLFVIKYAISHVIRELQIESDSLFENLKNLDQTIEMISDNFWLSFEKNAIHEIDAKLIENVDFAQLFHYMRQYAVHMKSTKKILSKFIRKHREANHIGHLYMFGQKVSREFIPQNTLLVGIEYGGIEMPYLVNSLRFVQGKTKLPRASVKLSGYSSNNTNSIEYLYDVISPFDNVSKFINAEHVFILDGSVMTGRTLEQFVNLLPKNIDEIYSGFVSFNASNRYHHVTRINHGGVNPLILEGSIIGVKGAFSHTITKEEYTDEYGIFDINKHYTIQMLIQQQS